MVLKENENLIYKLAHSFSNNSIEDLYQVGVIGLNEAYNNYDASYGTKFSTYAYPYILGEMKKYIRENKGIKISREIYYLSSKIEKLIELMTEKDGKVPTTYDLSKSLNVDEWKIIEALGIRNCIRSLDEPIIEGNKQVYLKDIISNNEDETDNILLDEILEILDESERNIIENRYFCDKSQCETAKLMGYSQAKVSREEQKILAKLKQYYKVR